ncbi:MAG: GNAT family N-acetyltransferase [Microcoleaceae cyanobacterium]
MTIRSWMPEQDAAQSFKIYGDPEVMRFIRLADLSVDAVGDRLRQRLDQDGFRNNGTGSWAVVNLENQEILGAILLVQLPDNQGQLTTDYEIGWHFRKSSWGKGYATEAAQGIINYGFNTLNLAEIYAVVKPENHPSIRVTQRLGMTPLGLTNQYYNTDLLLFRIRQPKQ